MGSLRVSSKQSGSLGVLRLHPRLHLLLAKRSSHPISSHTISTFWSATPTPIPRDRADHDCRDVLPFVCLIYNINCANFTVYTLPHQRAFVTAFHGIYFL